MTVNGSLLGRESLAQMIRGNNWGEEATTGKGFLMLDDGLSYSQESIAYEENGSVWPQDSDKGTVSTGLDYKQYLRFDDLRGIAFTLGSGAYQDPVELNSGKGDFRHVISPSGDNFGDYATIAMKKGAMVQTFPSVKFAGFTISGQTNPGRMEVKYHAFANNMVTNSINYPPSSFDSLQYLQGNGGIAFFRNLRLWINDRDAAALGQGDLLSNSLTSFEFSFQRQLVSDYTNCSGFEIEEPVEDSFAETTINLGLRNYDIQAAELFDKWQQNGRLKLKIEVVGAAATSASGDVSPASLIIELPNVAVENVEPGAYAGPGRISSSVNLKALALPTGQTAQGMDFNQPFRLQAVNAQNVKAVL